jgi:hypothetical protein
LDRDVVAGAGSLDRDFVVAYLGHTHVLKESRRNASQQLLAEPGIGPLLSRFFGFSSLELLQRRYYAREQL